MKKNRMKSEDEILEELLRKELEDGYIVYDKGNQALLDIRCDSCGNIIKDKKEYRKTTCRECWNEKSRNNMRKYKDSVEGYLEYLLKTVKQRAEKKGHDYNLDLAFLLDRYDSIEGKCEVTNIPMIISKEGTEYNNISIDRVNNNKGYTKDNIQLVCLGFNKMKNDMDNKTFYELVTKTYEYMQENKENYI